MLVSVGIADRILLKMLATGMRAAFLTEFVQMLPVEASFPAFIGPPIVSLGEKFMSFAACESCAGVGSKV